MYDYDAVMGSHCEKFMFEPAALGNITSYFLLLWNIHQKFATLFYPKHLSLGTVWPQ
jgi:hypothetical protein